MFMKFPAILFPVLLLFVAGCSSNKDGLDSIFNGQDLSGWNYKNADCWQVKDGILHAVNDPEQKGDILQTAKSYKNFIFQADFKFGEGRIDTGIFHEQLDISFYIPKDCLGFFIYMKDAISTASFDQL